MGRAGRDQPCSASGVQAEWALEKARTRIRREIEEHGGLGGSGGTAKGIPRQTCRKTRGHLRTGFGGFEKGHFAVLEMSAEV